MSLIWLISKVLNQALPVPESPKNAPHAGFVEAEPLSELLVVE
jgi:hypothetical protein